MFVILKTKIHDYYHELLLILTFQELLALSIDPPQARRLRGWAEERPPGDAGDVSEPCWGAFNQQFNPELEQEPDPLILRPFVCGDRDVKVTKG